MFERYTEKARRVVFFARWEALRFETPQIDTEHILLGILREDSELTEKFLSTDQIISLRQQMEGPIPPTQSPEITADLPLSDGSKRVLAYAGREAQTLEFGYIAPAHLLFGLLCEAQGVAAKLLNERGVTLDKVKEWLKQIPHERRSWSFHRKSYGSLHIFHMFSLLALALLLVQIFGLALEHHLYRSNAVFDAVAVAIVMSVLLGSTWFLETHGKMTRRRAMRYLIGAPVAVVPAYILIIYAFLAQPPR